MDESIRKILTDEKLIENREKWFQKMQNVYDGTDTDKIVLKGITGTPADPELVYTDPEEYVRQCAKDLAKRAYDAVSEDYFAPLCIDSILYGVHFIDKMFGAEVFFQSGQWYNRKLKNEVGELQKPDLEHNEVWDHAKRIAKTFTDLDVTVPLFGLPTIASALNIAVNLYGEEILVAMLMEPEAAHHDLQIINDVLMELHQWYREHIPESQLQTVVSWMRTQPVGYGQICGCTTQLLSADLYEEFIYDLDNALLGVYQHGGMIHLCGHHRQLIPLFARMENLTSIQLNDAAAEDLEYYVEGLRENQVIYLNPCAGMPAEKALEIGKDKRMIIVPE